MKHVSVSRKLIVRQNNLVSVLYGKEITVSVLLIEEKYDGMWKVWVLRRKREWKILLADMLRNIS